MDPICGKFYALKPKSETQSQTEREREEETESEREKEIERARGREIPIFGNPKKNRLRRLQGGIFGFSGHPSGNEDVCSLSISFCLETEGGSSLFCLKLFIGLAD